MSTDNAYMRSNRQTVKQMMEGVERDDSPKLRKIANNTVEYYRHGHKVVRLHNTDIITYTETGFILNSGGFKTGTTKERLNTFLNPHGIRVWTAHGIWYVSNNKGQKALFTDGMRLPEAFANGISPADEKKAKKLTAAICKFVNKIEYPLPQPDAGDCLLCYMWDATTNKTMGDQDQGHLLNHIEEGYIHGSLIYNAMVDAGWTRTAMSWAFSHTPTSGRPTHERNTVRRYLRRRLGLPV